jgi:hypothetical protein
MVKKTMNELTGGQKAHITNLITNYHKSVEDAVKYAKDIWGIELDLTDASFQSYMNGPSDTFSPSVSDLHETTITEALARNISTWDNTLKSAKHQYVLPSGERLDVLAEDSGGSLVVIELKKDAGPDVLIQILDYMAKMHKLEPTKKVRGIIMSHGFDQGLADRVKLLSSSGIELRYFTLKVLPQTEDDARKVPSV